MIRCSYDDCMETVSTSRALKKAAVNKKSPALRKSLISRSDASDDSAVTATATIYIVLAIKS